MKYVSTRGRAPAVSFTEAIMAGLAPDGGLYVPQDGYEDVSSAAQIFAKGHFTGAGLVVLHALKGTMAEDDAAPINRAYLGDPHSKSYAPHWPQAATPLVQLGPGSWALELFHGPSMSFKDVAMQWIAQLYEQELSRTKTRLTVVCATSGDTGGAAAEAFKTTDRVDLFILLPKGRVSDVQRRFMTASGAPNVFALEVEGDFDDCQALVKGLFADRDFTAAAHLSGVNSINWARIMAQSVYYHVAAHTLGAKEPVHFAVPTGNFGDAFSGYVAKRMGAPIGRIGLGVNANDILARALATGRYERSPASFATVSPAMDIQVASNFERMLYEALEGDAEQVAHLYTEFAKTSGFAIPPEALAAIRDTFFATSVSDEATLSTMSAYATGPRPYLVCPHTAVGLSAWRGAGEPLLGHHVTLATAHPAKFPETVAQATGQTPLLPAHCADLFDRPEIIHPIPASLDAVRRFIRERSRAWSQN
jgi:threonine synthase